MSKVDATALRQFLNDLVIDVLQETGEVLGRGFYGDVVIVKYDGLRCAGKKVHESALATAGEEPPPSGDAPADEEPPPTGDAPQQEPAAESADGESLEERFGNECRRISQLRHPNVVQLLAVHVPAKEVEGATPTLVMELLPFNLPAVLEKHQIPTYTKRSILLDVATGLQYLHGRSPPIVHGHLSPNSVLLTASLQAKITACFVGFGVPSRIKNLIYAAPECRRGDPPSARGDVFGFGNLIIHVFLQKELMLIEDSSLTEVQRRERFLNDVEDGPQMTELAKKCLNDDPLYRPTSAEVVYQLEEFIKANPPEYASYLDMLGALDKLSYAKETIATLNSVIQAKDGQLEAERQQQESLKQEIEAKEQQIEARKEEIEVMKQAVQSKHKLVQAHESAVRSKDALIKAKANEVAAKESEVAAKDSLLRIARKRIESLEQQAVLRRGPAIHVRTPSVERGDLLSPGLRSESPLTAPKPIRPKLSASAEAEDIHAPPPVVMRRLKGRRGNAMVASDGYRFQNWGMQKSKSMEVSSAADQKVDPKLAAWIAKRQQIEEESEAAEVATKPNDLGSIQEGVATVNGSGDPTPQ